MPEPLLAILKLCALALLYLFFFRVLRAVWAEVNAPKLAAAGGGGSVAGDGRAAGRRRSVDHLVVVEPPEQRGRAYELGEELTIGRSSACQVTLDDHFASQLHARVFRRDGTCVVEDLGSTNGTFLNNKRVSSGVPIRRGDQLKIGSTVLEAGG